MEIKMPDQLLAVSSDSDLKMQCHSWRMSTFFGGDDRKALFPRHCRAVCVQNCSSQCEDYVYVSLWIVLLINSESQPHNNRGEANQERKRARANNRQPLLSVVAVVEESTVAAAVSSEQ